MTEQKVRQSIRCWNCKNVFTLLIDTAGNPELSLTCPFCGASIHINLAQFPTTVTTVLKNVGDPQPKEMTVFRLPEIIETEQPDKV